MALSVNECDEMIDAARRASAVLAVGLVRRFLPEIQLAKTIIDSGVLGLICSFEVREGRIYDWKPSSDFFLKRKRAGGGVLVDSGVHVLDTMLFLLGELSVDHYADDSYGGVEAEVELRLAFGSSGTGFVELSRTRELSNTSLIHGADATLEIDLPRRRVTVRRGSSNTDLFNEGALGYDIFGAQLADWIKAIRTRQPPSVGGEQGRRSIVLIEACYASRTLLQLPWVIRSGRTLRQAAGLPHEPARTAHPGDRRYRIYRLQTCRETEFRTRCQRARAGAPVCQCGSHRPP